ncbi:MAG TPA: hypothetical protein VI385_16270 [Flavisolibacter sp.]
MFLLPVRATIVLLCFFVYFFDTTAAVSHFKESSRKQSCCKKMTVRHKMPAKCPQDKKDCTRDCFNCPLSYLATITATISIYPVSISFHPSYSSVTAAYLKGYQPKVWKPPDRV